VHLINEAIAFRIDDCCAGKKLVQQGRPARAVDTGEPRDRTAPFEHQFFRFQENSTGIASRLGFAFFSHPRAITLRINAGTTGEKQLCFSKSIEQIACAIQIDLSVRLDSAASRTRTVNNSIECSGALRDLIAV
jgi:hypothetical protein